MAVLVTGGAGYIGGHMNLGLLDAGEKVVALDNLSTGFAWAVPETAKLVVGDFGNSELVARLIHEHEVDAIAHFAAKIVASGAILRIAQPDQSIFAVRRCQVHFREVSQDSL